MSRSKPLSIGGLPFDTQSAAKFSIRQLLNSQPVKEVISEPNHSFLRALVSRHPQAAEKVGLGVRHFTVEHAVHGTLCFYLTRVDGTKTNFSYIKCVESGE